MHKTKKNAKTHAKASNNPAQQPRQPNAIVLAPVPTKLVDEGRKQSNYIIDTLSKTAMTLAGGEGASEKVAVIERLWAMQKDAEDRQSEREFGIAKVALAMEMPTIPKTRSIKFIDKNQVQRDTPYADRADIERALDPICRKHGFSKEYSTETIDGKSCQVLTVRHVAGHKEVFRSPYMPLDTGPGRNNLQAAGSTSEYGKRYALIGAFNIIGADKDDDGNLGEPTGDKQDKFTARVGEQAGKEDIVDTTPMPDEDPRVTLGFAIEQLERKLIEASTVERKGEILMKNIRILKELEINGDMERVTHLRALAEGKANG